MVSSTSSFFFGMNGMLKLYVLTGKIRDSNRPMLIAALQSESFPVVDMGKCLDIREEIMQKIIQVIKT